MKEPNLHFDESFFIGEEIEGFYVESMMKRAWASELEVLYEIDRICKKYDIQYFADSGTLLGAIRHKGFIPWDDDIDISMMRKDYQKFFSVLKHELPDKFLVMHSQFEHYVGEPHASVRNSDVCTTNEDFLRKFHGCPFITGVDVFPIDYVPRDEEEAAIQKEMAKVLMLLAKADKKDPLYESQLCAVEEMLGTTFDRNEDVEKQIVCLADRLISMYREDESDDVSVFSFYVHDEYPRIKKEWYKDVVYVPFVNMMIPVPAEYDKILTAIYGDYMTPVRGGSFHDYPFYKGQQELMEKVKNEQL